MPFEAERAPAEADGGGGVAVCGAVEAETMSGMAAGYEQAPTYPAHPQVT